MTEVKYCTREDVKAALDYKETARSNALIDVAIEAASRDIEGLTHRKFYPLLTTRRFDWPNHQHARLWRLWLDAHELVSVTTLTSGSTTIADTDYFLYPTDGPPYNRLELDRTSSSSFGQGTSHQRDIAILGVFAGCAIDESPAGELAEALDSSETGVDVTNSAVIGVGSIIRCESERMIVTEKTMLTSGQTLQTPLTASNANDTVAVTTGSSFFVGETILLDSERMLIVDISGNNLTVKRAWDGSTLAAHTGSTIYAPRTLTVERGALGTTAASHSTATSLVKFIVPSLIRQYAKALAINNVLQDSSGWARTSGSGESEREASGKGLAKMCERVYATYGRKARTRAV